MGTELTAKCGDFSDVRTSLRLEPSEGNRPLAANFSCPYATNTEGGRPLCAEMNQSPCPVYAALFDYLSPNGHLPEGRTEMDLIEIGYVPFHLARFQQHQRYLKSLQLELPLD